MAEFKLSETEFTSQILGNSRRVWLQEPATAGPPQALCLFLDCEYYLRM